MKVLLILSFMTVYNPDYPSNLKSGRLRTEEQNQVIPMNSKKECDNVVRKVVNKLAWEGFSTQRVIKAKCIEL